MGVHPRLMVNKTWLSRGSALAHQRPVINAYLETGIIFQPLKSFRLKVASLKPEYSKQKAWLHPNLCSSLSVLAITARDSSCSVFQPGSATLLRFRTGGLFHAVFSAENWWYAACASGFLHLLSLVALKACSRMILSVGNVFVFSNCSKIEYGDIDPATRCHHAIGLNPFSQHRLPLHHRSDQPPAKLPIGALSSQYFRSSFLINRDHTTASLWWPVRLPPVRDDRSF